MKRLAAGSAAPLRELSTPPRELIGCIKAVLGELLDQRLGPAGVTTDPVAAGTHTDPVAAGGTAGTTGGGCCVVVAVGASLDAPQGGWLGCLGTGMHWLVHSRPPPLIFPLPSLTLQSHPPPTSPLLVLVLTWHAFSQRSDIPLPCLSYNNPGLGWVD